MGEVSEPRSKSTRQRRLSYLCRICSSLHLYAFVAVWILNTYQSSPNKELSARSAPSAQSQLLPQLALSSATQQKLRRSEAGLGSTFGLFVLPKKRSKTGCFFSAWFFLLSCTEKDIWLLNCLFQKKNLLMIQYSALEVSKLKAGKCWKQHCFAQADITRPVDFAPSPLGDSQPHRSDHSARWSGPAQRGAAPRSGPRASNGKVNWDQGRHCCRPTFVD